MFAFQAMAVQPGRTHGIDVGAEIRDVLWSARMLVKQAALTMGYHESSHLCRALDGHKGYALDLWRIVELPDDVQERIYARILVRLRSLRIAKAALQSNERKTV